MRSALLLAATTLVATACSHGVGRSVPARRCDLVIWHRPARDDARVELVAGWEAWVGSRELVRAGDGWRAISLRPPPGEQLYAILEDGVWTADATVATTAFARVGGQLREVSVLDVPECGRPAIVLESVSSMAAEARLEARFVTSEQGDPIDPSSARATLAGGPSTVSGGSATPGGTSLPVRVEGDRISFAGTLGPGKHRVLFTARDTAGKEAESATATAWIEQQAWDWRDAVIYQVIVDRFRDRTGKVLATPSRPSARAGGHLDGVRAAIEDGSLAALGVNTLWLSPLYANPKGDWPGLDGRSYSSYHGYWPVAPRALEASFGDESSLDALVAAAHARSMRVLFDVVPNHVHQEHPYVAAHPTWFNRGAEACVCGAPGCDWATHELTCQFAPYLPDFDFRDLDASRQVASDVAWWIDRFDGDGIRIDAVPLIPRSEIRRIASTLRKRWDHPGNRTFCLGETFVGANDQSALRYFLGPFGLDSEFDFPLMWALRSALAEKSAPMSAIDEAIRRGAQAWEGSGAVMALIVGNHDVPRFVSIAHGDSGDGWNPAPQPTDAATIDRLGVALGALFALPGAPTLYYGDEVALAGVGDPDQRRVMPDETALSTAQRALRDQVRAMGKARACLPALRRGSYRTLAVDDEHLVFARELDGAESVIVVLTRGAGAISTPLAGVSNGSYVDVLSRTPRVLDAARTTFDEPAASVRYYLPSASACLRGR